LSISDLDGFATGKRAVDGETDPDATIPRRDSLVTLVSPDGTASGLLFTEEDVDGH
jgi:hypothetical protein